LAYPEPTPVLKGKAAKELMDELRRSDRPARATKRWVGSREVFEKLSHADSDK
jgi:hypothetical protein